MTAKLIAKPIGGEPPAQTEKAPAGWTFIKQQTVGQTLRFKDGSVFKFRKIKTGQGFLSSSRVTTTDKTLAANLRSLSETGKNGVVEITAP